MKCVIITLYSCANFRVAAVGVIAVILVKFLSGQESDHCVSSSELQFKQAVLESFEIVLCIEKF